MALLEIDIGNTRVKWRIRQGSKVLYFGSDESKLIKAGEFDRAFAYLLNQDLVKHLEIIKVVSVVSSCHQSLDEWCQRTVSIRPYFAYVERQTASVVNGYTDVSQMGVDRWLGILAAYQRHPDASIVVDAGSAITVDLIRSDGVHLGGYIVPGLVTMVNSLFSKTDQVKVRADSFPDSLLPGETTTAAVLSGIGQMVSSMIKQVSVNMSDTGTIKVFLTGGDAVNLYPWLKQVSVNSVELVTDLILDGLELANCKPLEDK